MKDHCGCGHAWSIHDNEGCKSIGWDQYSSMFCACMAPGPEKRKDMKKACTGVRSETGRTDHFYVRERLTGKRFYSVELRFTIAEYVDNQVQDWIKEAVMPCLDKSGSLSVIVGNA